MKAFVCCLAALFWLLAAQAAAAQTLPVFNSLVDRHGYAYEEAREALLERPDIVDVAWTALETTTYDSSTWLTLVLIEAVVLHLTHREEVERLHDLEGLNPDHYLQGREQSPSVMRELRELRHAAPLLIELFLKGTETYEWWSPAAPTAAEEEALRQGLLMAIGGSDHPASVYFLMDMLEDGCACCASCNTAIAALGETGSLQALPVLLEVLEEARGDRNVDEYTVALGALGRIPFLEVWPHLEAELNNPDARMREAAIRSAGRYGSRWSWVDNPVEGADIRAAVGLSLLDALIGERDERVVVSILEALSSVATPELRGLLEQRQPVIGQSPRSTRSTQPRAMTQGRLQRALDRLNRTLGR